MFSAVVVSLCLATAQNRPPPPPKLTFAAKQFAAIVNGKTFSASIDPIPEAKQTSTSRALYRKDDTYVVWDARGLSLRKKSAIRTTKLAGAPTSEMFWSKLEIAQNRILIDVERYDPNAVGLLDHRRIGSTIYMLARWQKPDGTTWFDGLITVDMSAANLAPSLIDRFAETITPVGQGALHIAPNSVSVIERGPTTWSVVEVDLKTKKKSRSDFAGLLESALKLSDGTLGYVENSDWETQAAGKFEWVSGRKSNLIEAKGKVGFLAGPGDEIIWTRDASALSLAHVDSSAKLKLDPAGRFRRIGPYVVTWTGGGAPIEAELYNPDRWVKIASWKKPAAK